MCERHCGDDPVPIPRDSWNTGGTVTAAVMEGKASCRKRPLSDTAGSDVAGKGVSQERGRHPGCWGWGQGPWGVDLEGCGCGGWEVGRGQSR